MYKKTISIIRICFVIGVIIVTLMSIAWIFLYLGLKFSKTPLSPQQTNGEFPYKLVYELDGQTHIMEGKFICKYKGISMNEARGKYRVWTGFVEGTDEKSVLLFENEEVKIYCYIGDAGYYMGDIDYSEHSPNSPIKPRLFCRQKNKDDLKTLSENDIFSKYKIKIIKWEFSKPIINSFA